MRGMFSLSLWERAAVSVPGGAPASRRPPGRRETSPRPTGDRSLSLWERAGVRADLGARLHDLVRARRAPRPEAEAEGRVRRDGAWRLGSGRVSALRLVLWALVAVLAARLALFALEASARLSNGFAAHYTASRLLLQGADVALFYDDAWFNARIAELAGPVYDLFRPNTPTASLLLLPVAWLDHAGARATWTLLGLACLAAAAVLLLRHLRARGAWLPACLAGLLLFQPVYEQVHQGQNYLVMLLLLTAAWLGYRRRAPALAGISLGLMLAPKLLGGYLWLLFLLERRWSALAWGIGTAAAVALASLPWIGTGAWMAFLGELPALAHQPDIAITAHQTQTGFLHHMLAPDPWYNPAPPIDAPWLAPGAAWAGFAALLGASLFAARRAPGSDLAFALMVMLNLILGPLSVDYQYTITLLPIALLAGLAREERSIWIRLAFGLGFVLIAADLPYRSPRLSEGAWALLAYPKLYGAWLLWAVGAWGCTKAISHQSSVSSEEHRAASEV